jgi:hypothetical protein
MYALSDDELVIFGYSNPPYFMEIRGLMRRGQAPHSWVLTDAGEAEYQRMLANGDGLDINQEIRLVTANAAPA